MSYRTDIAGIIIGSLIIVMFFDMIFNIIHTVISTYTLGINIVTATLPPPPSSGIFYHSYQYMSQLYTYLTEVLKDKYAVATLIAISIALTGLEVAMSS